MVELRLTYFVYCTKIKGSPIILEKANLGGNKMKRLSSILLASIIVFSCFFTAFPNAVIKADTTFGDGTIYYIDYVGGSDSNDGKSQSAAWQNLSKISSTTFNAGDTILLKRGVIWPDASIWVKQSGAINNPITVGAYGDENLEKPTVINKTAVVADGAGYNSVVHLANVNYVVIENLNLINAINKTSKMAGVRILTRAQFTTIGCIIRNCVINSESEKSWDTNFQENMTGINVESENYNGFIASVTIESNEINNVKGTGININGYYGGANSDGSSNPRSGKNVLISNNYLQNIGKDGILVNNCYKPVVEYNTVNKSHSYAKTSWHVAIWPFACHSAVFRYNEAYNTQTTYDGQGFDSDYQSYYSLFEHNYSHDNQGGFFLICTEPNVSWTNPPGVAYNVGTVIRYNISENDRDRIFTLTCQIKDTQIYNNTIYTDSGMATNIVYVYSRDGKNYPINTHFKNNIFYMNSGTMSWQYGTGKPKGTVFENNIFFGSSASAFPKNDSETTIDDGIKSVGNIWKDPKFMDPGKASVGIDTADGYMLKAGSPAFKAGVIITDSAVKDYFGNPVLKDQKPNIGAYNGDASFGDVNFDQNVNAKDVLTLRKYIAKHDIYIEFSRSDATVDAIINAKDILAIRKDLAGIAPLN